MTPFRLRFSFILMALLALSISLSVPCFAIGKDEAISKFTEELNKMGATWQGDANALAEKEVDKVIASMKSSQYDVEAAFDSIEGQVSALVKSSTKHDKAVDALDAAEGPVEDFKGMEAEKHLYVRPSIAGTPPAVTFDDSFEASQKSANTAIGEVRQILIRPDQPANVPAGDLISDFLPQIIRQLFRFAWLAVFVALTVSGVMFVVAHGEDERIKNAKNILYYSLIGFACIALAFAMVKAVTDIDFFRFI